MASVKAIGSDVFGFEAWGINVLVAVYLVLGFAAG
jgi:hypothetical protein